MRLRYRWFPVKFAKFWRQPFYTVDDCFWIHQNINSHKVSVLELIISKSDTEEERGGRRKLLLPTHINYQRCTLLKRLSKPCYKDFHKVTWFCKEYSHLCFPKCSLTLSWRMSLSYRNLQSKSMDWFLYDSNLRHERVKIYI